jgi:predicted RNA-binding Zn-ribbon protein involved in translation (DUF1610 family)
MPTTSEETGEVLKGKIHRTLGATTKSEGTWTAYVDYECPHCGERNIVRFNQPRAGDELRATCPHCRKEVRL